MNTYQMMNPEAFTEEYEDEQRVLRQLAQEKADHDSELLREGMKEVEFDDDCDICDIVRQYEENLTDERRDELNREREAEWMKFYDSGIDFPYEQ